MAAPGERSVPEVFQDIIGNLEDIIRSEVRLAKTEIKEEAAKAAKPTLLVGIGIVMAVYAVGFFLLTGVHALSMVLAPWLAALIVGASVALLAILLISSGSARLKQVNTVPQKTIESLKENVQWAKSQTR
ncbi:MAG TPA: phage holin family protein [Candidatus Dormibacteraeota bacterium]|nr:phage holin family protein [Candidatus Dormibacteraeota bacterium]